MCRHARQIWWFCLKGCTHRYEGTPKIWERLGPTHWVGVWMSPENKPLKFGVMVVSAVEFEYDLASIGQAYT